MVQAKIWCSIHEDTRELLRKRQAEILINEKRRVSFNDIIQQALRIKVGKNG